MPPSRPPHPGFCLDAQVQQDGEESQTGDGSAPREQVSVRVGVRLGQRDKRRAESVVVGNSHSTEITQEKRQQDKQTHEVRNEEAHQTLVEGIDHIHPKHVWLVFLENIF